MEYTKDELALVQMYYGPVFLANGLTTEGMNGWEIAEILIEGMLPDEDIKEIAMALRGAGFPAEIKEGSIGISHLIVERNCTLFGIFLDQPTTKSFEIVPFSL